MGLFWIEKHWIIQAEYRVIQAEYMVIQAEYRVIQAEYRVIQAEYRFIQAEYRVNVKVNNNYFINKNLLLWKLKHPLIIEYSRE